MHYVHETDATTCSDPQPTSDNIYNFVERHLLSLDPFSTMALGKLTYHTDFHPHYIAPERDGSFGKTLYKTSPSWQHININELGLVFFGEVCSSVYGTAISAKGNHYAGTAGHPKVCTLTPHVTTPNLTSTFSQPITDISIVKDVLVLCPLTIAPEDSPVDLAFNNQCAGLKEILIEDARLRANHLSSDSVCTIITFTILSCPDFTSGRSK